jgi:uncharacterized protein DUF3606
MTKPRQRKTAAGLMCARIDYWSNKFGVSKDELKAAVEKAGAYPMTWRESSEK